MIRIATRGAVYGEVWYNEVPPGDAGIDIVMHRHRFAPIDGAQCAPFVSLVNNLGADDEAIAGAFGKHCRQEIGRAEGKDGLQMEFSREAIARLEEFQTFYDDFARRKSIPGCYPQWLAAACDARQLVLTCARRGDETLVWHAYVIAEDTACLQYSASHFRDRQADYRALVGRANRWLHWQDMLRLKRMGIARYDWGGIFEDEATPERAGINLFKKQFGGRPERTYECTVAATRRGRIWLAVRTARRSVQSVLAWGRTALRSAPRASAAPSE